ncbi:MAG TPA: hypothetical protein VE732_03780, partial [Nitrososphaera sp.]|nr:hypothetical protein [Nitrososphaera sp.]
SISYLNLACRLFFRYKAMATTIQINVPIIAPANMKNMPSMAGASPGSLELLTPDSLVLNRIRAKKNPVAAPPPIPRGSTRSLQVGPFSLPLRMRIRT